ncbi:MAG: ferredoxin [Anaerotruncus sp.]|nr:ferredoxin [Anaerotruncus sp.]
MMVNIKINGINYQVPEGISILDAARSVGIEIPTLCYLRDTNEIGACRICVVEVKGARSLVAACVYPVAEGLEVVTNSTRIFESRRTTLELILSTHNKHCLSCPRSSNCELQKLCVDYGVEDVNVFEGAVNTYPVDNSAVHMYRDDTKCVLCRRCTAVCAKWQGVGVIGPNDRGFATHIGCAFEQELADVTCVSCGQCIVACPTGALCEKDHTQQVWDALQDPKKYVIVQPAPSIRATLGESFGMKPGTDVTGKLAASLRRLGFDKVFDTDLAADMTIVEEAHEFVGRVTNGGVLPMITSCSPGWIKYCEHYFPDQLEHLSSCKSPMQMFGATAKTWYAQKMGIDPKDLVVVAVMPCTAKKFEVQRDDQAAAGVPDVDIAITTRELARMIDKAGLRFADLPDEDFDDPMGESTGAGVIFGATGGVMEAALRTAAEWVGGKPLEQVEFSEVRGTEGIKEAAYQVGDLTVKVAVVSGLANAKKVMEKVRAGTADYHFIEIMACPGGCVNGGGQPLQPASVRNFTDLKALRAKVLYDADVGKPLRKSHENPSLLKIYEEFFGEFGSHKAHEVLHTSYVKRPRF